MRAAYLSASMLRNAKPQVISWAAVQQAQQDGAEVATDEQTLASATGAPGRNLLAENLATNRLAMPEPALVRPAAGSEASWSPSSRPPPPPPPG